MHFRKLIVREHPSLVAIQAVARHREAEPIVAMKALPFVLRVSDRCHGGYSLHRRQHVRLPLEGGYLDHLAQFVIPAPMLGRLRPDFPRGVPQAQRPGADHARQRGPAACRTITQNLDPALMSPAAEERLNIFVQHPLQEARTCFRLNVLSVGHVGLDGAAEMSILVTGGASLLLPRFFRGWLGYPKRCHGLPFISELLDCTSNVYRILIVNA